MTSGSGATSSTAGCPKCDSPIEPVQVWTGGQPPEPDHTEWVCTKCDWSEAEKP